MTMDFMCATFKCATFSAHFNVVKKLLSQLKMAYRRTSRFRRTSRRRTLSNYRIATRTGAKAQSRQIYALKRRINYIQKRTKPEILITRRTAAPETSSGSLESVTGNIRFAYGSSFGSDFRPQLPEPTTESNASVGVVSPNRFARLLSFKLTGSMNYADTPQITATPYVVRIVILQNRQTRAQALAANDVFLDTNPVFNALQSGLARTARVLSDRRYYLSFQRPVISIRTTLKRLTNYYNDTTSTTSGSSEAVPKGCISVCIAYRPMLNPSAPEGTTPVGNLNVILEGKLAYTDA